MAKNRKKPKEQKLPDFNLVVRNFNNKMFINLLKEMNNKYDESLILKCNNDIKTILLQNFEEIYPGFLVDSLYINILDLIYEVIKSFKDSEEAAIEKYKNLKLDLIEILKENNLKLTFYRAFVAVNLSIVVEGSHKLSNESKYIKDLIVLMKHLGITITTHLYKFKNNIALRCAEEDNGELEIKYSNKELIKKEYLKDFYSFTLGKTDINDRINTAYSNLDYFFRDLSVKLYEAHIDDEFINKDLEKVIYVNTFKNEFPLLNKDNKYILSKEEIRKVPNNKIYSIPKDGVRFDFTMKDKNISHIDLKEIGNEVFFKVYFNNNGQFYKSKLDKYSVKSKLSRQLQELVEPKKIYDNNINMTFRINKDYHSKVNTENIYIDIISGCFAKGQNEKLFKEQVDKVLLTCLYLAYNAPSKLSKEVTLYNRKIENQKLFIENYYKVHSLKRLPQGKKASAAALEKAKQLGFDVLPEGYTVGREIVLNRSSV